MLLVFKYSFCSPEDGVKKHLPSLTARPLKNGGWKTILSYWERNFSGLIREESHDRAKSVLAWHL